jgi:hypothetical protein
VALQIGNLRDRIAEWAAEHHGAELQSGMELFLGHGPREPHRVYGAIAFALIAPPPGGGSLLERYAARPGHRPRAERALLDRWAATWFSLLRVTAVRPGEWVDVHDVLRDVRLRVHERAGSRSIPPGTWLAAFFHEDDRRWVFEGTIEVVVPQARIHAVQAALAAASAASGPPEPAASRRLARPVAAAIDWASRPPRLLNADRHDVLLVTSTLDLPWSRVLEVAGAWDDAEVHEDHVDVAGAVPAEHVGDRTTRATFRHDDRVVTLFTNSRERHDEILARWERATSAPMPRTGEEVATVPSDPLGQEIVVDGSSLTLPEGVDADTFTREHLAAYDERWLDEPLPVLDGLTPRAALAAGRSAEIRALLPPEEDRAARLAAALGLS